LQRNAHWIFQAFGVAKLHGGKRAEGESLLLQAEKINPRHAPTLVEIGYLRETDGDAESAEQYYRRAIEADSNSAFGYFRLARLLYREGDVSQAYAMAKLALACRPLDNRNKELVDELKKRIDESENQTSP
jgi:tetratricopeptide (TPR) repeat protein